MKVWIQGDSQVSQFLRKICSSRGMMLSSPVDCDLAVLNFPFSSISEELEKDFGTGQKIVCGMVDEKINRISEEKNWMLFQALKDETYLLENAKLTAEGAVFFAMQKASIALRDARCLVIGYGRIGKELTHLLRSFGADVTVAARRPESRKEAGENSVSIAKMQSVLHKTDLILNTVPHPVLSESGMFLIKNTAFLIELASKPYGFNMEQAKRMGIHACLESGIPGRYCPESAARALFRYIERSVQIE